MGDPYLRKKENKWIIEQKIGGKTHYIMTLPPLLLLINLKRQGIFDNKASQINAEKGKNKGKEFAQELLGEPQNKDADIIPSPEILKKILEQNQND